MSTEISLHELLSLAIGTPDVGSVNFCALHDLMRAVLRHLKIERITTAWKDVDRERGSPSHTTALIPDRSSPFRAMEEKVRWLEEQMLALESLPSASQLIGSDGAVSDMWTLMQLRRKAQGNEDGVSKCMALIQDLLKEIQGLQESRHDLTQKVEALHDQLSQLNMSELAGRIVAMEQYCHRVEDLDNTTKELREKLAQYPLPDELTQCVTWEVMQTALISERQKIQEGLKDSITVSAAKETVPEHPLNQSTPFKHDRSGTGVSPPHQSPSDGALFTATGRRLSRVSIGAEQYPETVEALIEVGRLRDRHENLEARVGQLEANKADQTQLQHLSDLITAMGERQIPNNVPEQLNYLRTLVDSLIADKEKVSELDSVLMNMRTAGEDTGSASSQQTDASQTEQMSLLISHIRSAVLKLDGKVQVLIKETHDREKERRSKDRHIQEQNSELVSVVQEAILQLQVECEKLHSTTSHLMEDHSKSQMHIDRLYKTVEELDEKKADKQLVEMEIEIKADRRALESMVSRIQFDSMTEQLNNMLQEMLSKISRQEQDWHKVTQKISSEMDCKLNRFELDPLKKQLDERWRSIHRQLQAPQVPEQDDAAGLRKQLVARFHCISCDRPVDMMTPGQHLATLPSAPGLPAHKSNRPYTVYELEQVRQHCRGMPSDSNQDKYRMARSERGVRQDQRSHALTGRQIEARQFPTTRTPGQPYSRALPELSQHQYRPHPSPLKKSSWNPSKTERIPEMADYSYLARNCGGSHTLSYPNRRYTRLQNITHLIQAEEESQPVSSAPHTQAEEVDILGLNGQVYKGRINNRAVKITESRLPTISSREGNCKSKDKVSRSQSQRSSGVDAGRGSPARPQSAIAHPSRSASSSSVQDRPMSSMDCLSHGIMHQSSFHDTTTELKQGLELHKDLNQSEDEPVTSL